MTNLMDEAPWGDPEPTLPDPPTPADDEDWAERLEARQRKEEAEDDQ